MSLLDVARRLRSSEIDRIVAPFREKHVALRRAFVLLLILAWTLFWQSRTNNAVLSAEARAVLPWVATLFSLSVGWAVLVRLKAYRDAVWVDPSGTVADFFGVTIFLTVAWNMMVPLVVVLPLACITTGARYSQRAFYLAIFFAVVVVGISAPEGYWSTRPVVAVLAIALIAGMPLTVNRVLTGLRKVSEQAIQARDSQSRFLAMMSHELKTPLHTVIHAAALVDVDNDPEEQRSLVNAITTNASVLLARVTDVLDVAANDGGRLILSTQPFDLRSVMNTVTTVVEPQALAKGIMLSMMYDKDAVTTLVGDSRRIEQVVTNLAGNAVKYSGRGGSVVVSASAHILTSDSLTADLVVTVADTGIGIPDDEKARIFEPFHQVSSGETRNYDGVGLGLHIVKSISDRMSGVLTVEDNPGGGTLFTWRLNLPRADAQLSVGDSTDTIPMLRAHRDSVSPLRCLVVDDNPSNRDILGKVLLLAGHSPLFAHDGEHGLAILKTEAVDVTFLDLHMPGLSGWDVLEHLRRDTKSGPMPTVVILSAATDPNAVARAKALGAHGYLQKPMSVPLLLKILADVSRSRQSDSAHFAGPAAAAASPLAVMRSISDPSSVRSYIQACIAELTASLEASEAAYRGENLEHLRDCLHRLKNAFMSSGLTTPTQLATLATNKIAAGFAVEEMPELRRMTAAAVASLKASPELE